MTKQKSEPAAPVYTKAQFLASNQFTPIQKDVLRAILKDGETYTHEQVQKMIEDFAKRKVK
jgi:hypothetical protein